MIENVSYKEGEITETTQVMNLYLDAGWINYTINFQNLFDAISNSLFVLTAWENEKLIGLLRIVGDGLSIIYIQDILVLKSHKRQKVGSRMMEIALEKFKQVRQVVLLTDDKEESKGFYQSLGFKTTGEMKLISFVKINRM